MYVVKSLCDWPSLFQIASGVEVCHCINESLACWLHAHAVVRARRGGARAA